VPPLMPIYCLLNRQEEASTTGNPKGSGEAGRLHGAGCGRSATAGRGHPEFDAGSAAAHRHGDGGRRSLFRGYRHH
jgi:hypothetical protein